MIGDAVGSGSKSTEPCRKIWAQVGDGHEAGIRRAEGSRCAGAVNQFVEGNPEIMVKVTDREKVDCWSTAFRIRSSFLCVEGCGRGNMQWCPVMGNRSVSAEGSSIKSAVIAAATIGCVKTHFAIVE